MGRNECKKHTDLNDSKEQYVAINTKIDIIKVNNELILALEDIIEYLGNACGTWGNSGDSLAPLRSKYFDKDCIKLKVIKIKTQYMRLLQTLKEYMICDNNIKANIERLYGLGNYYIDEILGQWMIRNDTKKAIEDAHDMCYRLRKLNKKLNIL